MVRACDSHTLDIIVIVVEKDFSDEIGFLLCRRHFIPIFAMRLLPALAQQTPDINNKCLICNDDTVCRW